MGMWCGVSTHEICDAAISGTNGTNCSTLSKTEKKTPICSPIRVHNPDLGRSYTRRLLMAILVRLEDCDGSK